MQTIILAGGLGTRLRPITQTIPKALVPVLGRPFIDYQLKWLARCGIQQIILSTGYLGHMIQEHVQSGDQWGLDVQYVEEGKELMGTAGALKLILEKGLLHEKFLLTYGDSFLPVDFMKIGEALKSCGQPALMSILKNGGKWDSSNVCFDGEKISLYDKRANPKPPGMDFIDYGVSGFQRKTIEDWIPSQQKYDLADVFHQLSLRGLLAGYEVKKRFYEVGSVQGIQDFENYLRSPEQNPYQVDSN